jgi:folate-binding protein YgfZ
MSDSYGDVTAEYLALRGACGLVTDLHQAVVVSGADAVAFLQGLLSQDLELAPGSITRSFLLSPQGKLAALLWVLRGEEEVILVTDGVSGDQLVADLNRFRIRVDAVIRVEDSPVLELWGPASTGVLESIASPVDEGWKRTGWGWIARLPMGGLDRYLLAGQTEEKLLENGAVRCGSLAATAVRIEAGEPMMGRDVDTKTIPQETGLVPEAVSFTKGCYLGQELVARIDSRGHVNRRLLGVRIGENVLPPEGAEVVGAGRTVGFLGSVGESLNLRSPVAMGLIRREVAAGDPLEVRWDGGSVPAVAVELPLDVFTDR